MMKLKNYILLIVLSIGFSSLFLFMTLYVDYALYLVISLCGILCAIFVNEIFAGK